MKRAKGKCRRGGFTLVELLVVLGIISLIMSMLLPSLARAREAASKVQCASNLRSIGQAISMFANVNHGRVPYAQSTGWGVGPWWNRWIYSYDFFQLTDKFGAPLKVWTCPTVAAQAAAGSTVGFQAGTEAAARQQIVAIETSGTISNYTGTSSMDRLAWIGGAQGYTGGVTNLYADPVGYTYMGASGQIVDPATIQPFWVTKLSRHTKTNVAADDENPPLMADECWYQSGMRVWNHGRTWNPQGLNQTTGLVSRQQGDINVNVLHTDGSVSNKAPDKQAYSLNGAIWFR